MDVLGNLASSKRVNAIFVISICISESYGNPTGLPRGKSENINLGTPHCSTMSRADPIITVGILFFSRCLAIKLTV